MERIEEFIEALKEKGIRIWSDNEKLRYQAAKGAMDSQTLEKIKEKKVETFKILEPIMQKNNIHWGSGRCVILCYHFGKGKVLYIFHWICLLQIL